MKEAVYPFEDTGENLSLLPLAARRALDVAGFRLSLEGYQSLSLEDRLELTIAGTRDKVDVKLVEQLVRLSLSPATRIKPTADPDPDTPPEQLSAESIRGRLLDPFDWRRLRAVDRYALVHIMRRSIAREDPERLEVALATILGESRPPKPASLAPQAKAQAKPVSSRPPAPVRASEKPGVSAPPAKSVETSARSLRRSAIPEMPAVREESERPIPLRERKRVSSVPPPAVLRVPERRDAVSSRPPPPGHASEGPYRQLEGGLNKARRALPNLLDSGEFAEPAAADSLGEVSNHLNERGEVHMVDVGAKSKTARRASAKGSVQLQLETAQRLLRNDVPKGEVLATARLAGIMAAKRTPELIPLCHHVALTSVDVLIDVERSTGIVTVTAVTEATDRTGVEMEALTAVSVACLTIYDMLKGIDREMVISDIKLLTKGGGRGGPYVRKE